MSKHLIQFQLFLLPSITHVGIISILLSWLIYISLFGRMNPSLCEFIAENELIQIVPNFNERPIHLLRGDIGPFEAGSTVQVPIWFAMHLKRKHKCTIVAPEWLNIKELKKMIMAESERNTFSPLPECFFEITHILVANAIDDLDQVEQLKTFVKDLQDKREAKMRTSVIKFLEQYQNERSELRSGKAVIHANAQMANLTRFEISYFRAALTESSKQLDRLFEMLYLSDLGT